MVPEFFMNLFPKLGVFLAVLLAILILFGFTGAHGEKWVKWIGVAGAIIIVVWAFSDFYWWGSGGFSLFNILYSDYIWSLIILGLAVGAVYWISQEKKG